MYSSQSANVHPDGTPKTQREAVPFGYLVHRAPDSGVGYDSREAPDDMTDEQFDRPSRTRTVAEFGGLERHVQLFAARRGRASGRRVRGRRAGGRRAGLAPGRRRRYAVVVDGEAGSTDNCERSPGQTVRAQRDCGGNGSAARQIGNDRLCAGIHPQGGDGGFTVPQIEADNEMAVITFHRNGPHRCHPHRPLRPCGRAPGSLSGT